MISRTDYRGESEEYENEEEDEDYNLNVAQSTRLRKADLLHCEKVHLGNESVYHGAVKVNNILKISAQSGARSPAVNGATSPKRIGYSQNHTVLARPFSDYGANASSAALQHQNGTVSGAEFEDNTSQHLGSSNELYGNYVLPHESSSINDGTTPLLSHNNEAKKFKGKYIAYLCLSIIGVITLISVLIYEVILCYGSNPSEKDNLPMNFTARLVTRGEWFALQPKQEIPPLKYIPPPFVIVGHTASSSCNDRLSCRKKVRNIQEGQLAGDFFDIMYNYLVAGDGYIYEGRGWNESSAGVRRMGCSSLFIGFVGNFVIEAPPLRQLNAFKLILENGVASGKLDANFKMFMQKQIAASESPGEALIEILITWPHWSPFSKEDFVCDNANYRGRATLKKRLGG
nr:PGRPL1a [Rhodnius prolixus]